MTAKLCREQAPLSRCRPATFGRAARHWSREGRHFVDSDSPKSPAAVGPPMGAAQARVGQLRGHALGPELARHLGEHLLAGGEVDGQIERADAHPLAASARSHISMRSSSAFHRATCSNALEVEIGVEFTVHHREHVAVELRRHAGAVVIGAHQPTGVLDQVGAQQQGVARLQRVGQRRQEIGPRPRRQVADRGAEEHHQSPADPRDLAEVFLEIAADSVDLDARILVAGWPNRPPAAPRRRRRTGRTGAAIHCRATRLSSSLVFSEVPLPSSTNVSAPDAAAISAERSRRISRLGAGRVVLGQPGDLVEQVAAHRVVEPLGRQRFRRLGQAVVHIAAQRLRRRSPRPGGWTARGS